MSETWKAVVGFEGLYEVSDLGRVRSITRRIRARASCRRSAHWRTYKGQMLRPGPSPLGHQSVVLGKGNTEQVHQLVLAAFVGPCPKGHEGLHNNGVASYNRASNLRYGTRSQNNRDITAHGRRRLTPGQAQLLRAKRCSGATYRELGEEFGICQSQAYNIASGAHYHV